MKRWWFKHQKGNAAAPTLAAAPVGFLLPLPADSLLCADHRRKLLERIWQYTALSEPQFNQLYLDPIRRYAAYVQQLPASESHHHAYPGGMLDHGLELVACSLKLRQSYLLPSGAAPEDQAAQADAWSAAVAYGALLHDIGKIAVDVQVEYQNGEVWHPWHGPLTQPYRFRYVAGRDYKLHGAAAGLLYTQILMARQLDWLSSYPVLWSHLLFLLTDHYEHAGTLGELVLQADRVSTAQNIGANPTKALQAPKHSLQHHLLTGLRHLVKNEFKLNQPGAAGWLTQDHLWLVSKTATDKLRAYLLAQAVDGIPSSNIALFDELQSHGLVDATPEGKAVWSAAVTDGDWLQRFTFLRLQPCLIWGEGTRPHCFAGTIELVVNIKEADDASKSLSNKPLSRPTEESPGSAPPPAPHVEYFDHFQDLFSESAERKEERHSDDTGASAASFNKAPGRAFVNWLIEGIRNHSLIINESKAKIHIVAGKIFLVSPGIFQHYINEHPHLANESNNIEAWRVHQRNFERLEMHQKRRNGQNIWTCTVKGQRKTTSLNGYLLQNSRIFPTDLPNDNIFLTLDK
ncbi:relaxase [Pseudomonas hunanensis]|uniref:Relaxase n=1 Tax=Pseudomonas hunanensis TaxID=1247546 RepID=A0ABD6N8P5_9PSED|nr:MobH family relaxase [Pseudomonas hunanensis]NWL48715.1 relaxase [Pseudomonas hunanensis]